MLTPSIKLLRSYLDSNLIRLLTCSRVYFCSVQTPEIEEIRKSHGIPFSRASLGSFWQNPPKMENAFLSDSVLQTYLKRYLPKDVHEDVYSDLLRFGERVVTDVYELSRECERNPPYMRHFDAWGRRIDDIVTSHAWKRMKEISAEEGLVAIPYERRYGEHSRLYQVAKLLLYNPSAGLYTCPLAMTDGASKTLENLPQLNHAYQRLISRDPKTFWTSGQWMTERGGGSDVGMGTETVAVPVSDGSFRLYGYKWFSSATDSDMTLTLARELDQEKGFTQGSRGLSMFYLETRLEDGALNNIEVVRLKDKLGTRQLPTAELLLDGCKATKLGSTGEGVKSISNVLEITRIHTGLAAVASMRRMLSLCRTYATNRVAFGRKLVDHPLHMRTLAEMELETRGCTLLLLHVARLLGLSECGQATEEDCLSLRILTPLLKLYASKQAVKIVSEGLEAFGGAGYLEDTSLPAMLRDTQVLPIWEGTTNILSLDVLRATSKSKGDSVTAIQEDIKRKLKAASAGPLSESISNLENQLHEFTSVVSELTMEEWEPAARDFSFSLAKLIIGSLLVEYAGNQRATTADITAAIRWCSMDHIAPIIRHMKYDVYKKTGCNQDKAMVMEGFSELHLHNELH